MPSHLHSQPINQSINPSITKWNSQSVSQFISQAINESQHVLHTIHQGPLSATSSAENDKVTKARSTADIGFCSSDQKQKHQQYGMTPGHDQAWQRYWEAQHVMQADTSNKRSWSETAQSQRHMCCCRNL